MYKFTQLSQNTRRAAEPRKLELEPKSSYYQPSDLVQVLSLSLLIY